MSNTLKNLKARVSSFSGYGADDLHCYRFEANAELSFTAETEEGEQLHAYIIAPVVVTSPDRPYQSHNIGNDTRSSDALEKLCEKDARWSCFSSYAIGAAIDAALQYEEIPELYALRYCHAVSRDLETFGELRQLGESVWERLQELDGDTPVEEEAGEEEADLLAMAQDLIDDDGRRVCDMSFEDFQDYLETQIDAYFLDFDVAISRRSESVSACALVACGGPHCEIEQFFDWNPEIVFSYGSKAKARVALHGPARDFFDSLVERYVY